jgi:hypothetical protein
MTTIDDLKKEIEELLRAEDSFYAQRSKNMNDRDAGVGFGISHAMFEVLKVIDRFFEGKWVIKPEELCDECQLRLARDKNAKRDI